MPFRRQHDGATCVMHPLLAAQGRSPLAGRSRTAGAGISKDAATVRTEDCLREGRQNSCRRDRLD